MAYAYITFAQAKAQLAQRLDDSGSTFFVDAELGFAIVQALRMWNVFTGHYRHREIFPTVANEPFYQLGSTLTYRTSSIRDRAVVSEMEYHLMEAQGLSAWAGTDQFTLTQLVDALQNRRNQFLADTACVLTERSYDVVGGEATLAEDVIGVRRAVFRRFDGRYYSLRPTDEHVSMTPQYLPNSGIPTSFSVAASPQQTVRLFPPPEDDSSTIEILAVVAGASLDTTASNNTGTLLNIPDDYVWAVKYGALADLFNSYGGLDSTRAEECEQLYRLGVLLATSMPVVLTAKINGVRVTPASLAYTDMRNNGWEGGDTGTPTTISIAGPELIALTRIPDSAITQIELDYVRTANVPTAAGDFIDVGKEHLDAVLGMAHHILTLKVGGSEHAATAPLSQQFIEQAQNYTYRRSALATALQAMLGRSTQQMNAAPWKHEPMTAGEETDEVKSERNARRRPFRKRG